MDSHILQLYLPYMEDKNKPKCCIKSLAFCHSDVFGFPLSSDYLKKLPHVYPEPLFHVGFNVPRRTQVSTGTG